MHNILQPSLPTKTKSNDIVEVADFHMNHIYCPYFKISHRRKRKIKIEPSVLNKLILGNSEEVGKIIKKYEEVSESSISQGKLF
jgi:predicted MPP superfamily phosphohydrolase